VHIYGKQLIITSRYESSSYWQGLFVSLFDLCRYLCKCISWFSCIRVLFDFAEESILLVKS
jgi:hypothetical protein